MDTNELQKVIRALQDAGVCIEDIEPIASCQTGCTSCQGTCQYCVSTCQRCNAGGQ